MSLAVDAFRAEGIALALGKPVERAVRRNADELVVRLEGGGEVRGLHLLVAVGRVPNTTDLGCEAQAGELVHVFAVMMQAEAPARALVDAECVHPTFAEGLQALVMRLPRYTLD